MVNGFPWSIVSFLSLLAKMCIGAYHNTRARRRRWEKVVAYGTVEETHTGDFLGMEASGKPFKVRNIDIRRFNAEGLIAEHWGLFDLAGMMRQLS